MDKQFNIIISGGGTGGHLIPAFAIADAFIDSKYNVKVGFVGSEKGIESKLYQQRSEKHYLLKIVGLNRDLNLKSIVHNLLVFPFRFFHSIIKTYKIFKEFKPDMVVGTGGYSSAIPLFVASMKGVKIAIQEQNSIPGLVNRLFLKKAEKVFFGVEPKSFKDVNYVVSGNPTRLSVCDLDEKVEINENNFTIFVVGGSQGSVPINNHFLNHYKEYLDRWKNVRLIWQCGENNVAFIKNQIHSKYIELHGFINNIEQYYLKSDLIIARSGALTLSEISNYKKASILIPFPFAANNHQLLNAQFYKKQGACEIVEQKQLEDGLLEKQVDKLIKNKNIIKSMEKKVFSISKPNAAQDVVDEILKICLIKVK